MGKGSEDTAITSCQNVLSHPFRLGQRQGAPGIGLHLAQRSALDRRFVVSQGTPGPLTHLRSERTGAARAGGLGWFRSCWFRGFSRLWCSFLALESAHAIVQRRGRGRANTLRRLRRKPILVLAGNDQPEGLDGLLGAAAARSQGPGRREPHTFHTI